LDLLIDQFFKKLSLAEKRLLFLDYDGTLAPFRKERDLAVPYPGVEERLDKIIGLKRTDVIIISGRAIADLKPLLKLKKYPEIWGSHGWERLSADGEYMLIEAGQKPLRGLAEARKYIENNDLGDYLEIKPVSLAVHFRGVKKNKVVELKDKIGDNWSRLETEYELTYSSFDGGLELKIPGNNKGNVVENVLKRYSRSTPAAYLGDDLTDEDAFSVLPENALGVLVRSEPKETAAKVRIKPPDELYEFLDRWIEVDSTS